MNLRLSEMPAAMYIAVLESMGFTCIPELAKADVGIPAIAWTDFAAGATKMTLFSGEVESLANKVSFARATNGTTNQKTTGASSYPVFSVSGVPDAQRPVCGEFGFLNPATTSGAMAIGSAKVAD